MEYPPAFRTAALRSRLVSRLTGLSVSRLQYWHETSLQLAHRRHGARGIPRLYSWVDYQRLCVIAQLLEQGVRPDRIRAAVGYLDGMYADWFRLTLTGWEGSVHVPGARGKSHIAIRAAAVSILADAAGQSTYRDHLVTNEVEATADAVVIAFETIATRGPLFRLSHFGDAVRMNPDVNVGLPTLEGTRLETSFVARLVSLSSVCEVANLYDIQPSLVERGVDFEREAA